MKKCWVDSLFIKQSGQIEGEIKQPESFVEATFSEPDNMIQIRTFNLLGHFDFHNAEWISLLNGEPLKDDEIEISL